MANEKKEQKNKKSGIVKIVFVLFIIFLLIPSLVIGGFYFLNDTFQYRLNIALSETPGPIGEYFDLIPTLAEKRNQINSIAEYYLEISIDRAVDKLILIYNDNPNIYNDIIKNMLQKDPNNTKYILEDIRDKQKKGDSVSNALNEIIEENNEELSYKANELQNIPFSNLKEELYTILSDGLNGFAKLAKIFEKMDPIKAYELLSLLDDNDKEKVLNSMNDSSKKMIEDEKNKDDFNNQKLISISEIYSSKNVDELLDVLVDDNMYTVDELAIIFNEIGIIKTGQILAKSEDSNFVSDVISEIKNNEVLNNGEDLITKDILKTLNIYKDFDDNIIELTNIYSDMSVYEVAVIIKRLITSGELPQVYVLNSGDIIEIDDMELALKILKNFDSKKVAEIISTFDESLASEISKKLTVPGY